MKNDLPIIQDRPSETSIFTIMTKMAVDYQAINLAQGFPEFDCDPVLLDLVSKHLKAGKNQYAPMSGVPKLKQAIATKIQKLYNQILDPENQICITAGATQALFTAITTFVKPKDEVVIIEPAYDSYRPSILKAGGIPIIYSLEFPEFKINWDEFGKLVNDRTKMIIINSPHNPTGQTLAKRDLESLEKIISNKDLVLLCDEVYEHITYGENIHQSVLSYPALFQKSIAIYSFGKTFHATGWKIGYCVGPAHLIKTFKETHQWNVFSVNSFIQFALADYLEEENHYLKLPKFFEKKLNHFNACMAEVPLKPLPTQGTYFQLYDYSEISDIDDFSFASYLTKEIGVAVIPLSSFQSKQTEGQVIRFCFAKELATLETAAKRLMKLR